MKATRRISRLVANEIQMAGRIQPGGLRYPSETKRMVGERCGGNRPKSDRAIGRIVARFAKVLRFRIFQRTVLPTPQRQGQILPAFLYARHGRGPPCQPRSGARICSSEQSATGRNQELDWRVFNFCFLLPEICFQPPAIVLVLFRLSICRCDGGEAVWDLPIS